jgi:hypothetical protein
MSGKGSIMVFYSQLIIVWEQHDGQNPSQVTKANQTLDKTRPQENEQV